MMGTELLIGAMVADVPPVVAQLIPRGSRVTVFQRIYWVFLILGTLVGIVVISYMIYNAYKYRATTDEPDDDIDRPSLGEVPQGGGGGKKLFLSFALSAIIVVSLIIWTYGTLLYVENDAPDDEEDQLEVTVVGYQFGWQFIYPNGHTTDGKLVVPEDRTVRLTVTSRDVFHTFGIPALRVKDDAIPGERTETWFVAEEQGTYLAECYELCGSGHSFMTAEVEVRSEEEFQAWYDNTSADNETAANNSITP